MADPLATLRDLIRRDVFVTSASRQIVSPRGLSEQWIFDFRRILLRGERLEEISDLLWREIADIENVQIGGLETASIPLIAGIMLRARRDGRTVNGFYVRKSRDKDGLQQMVEGALGDGPVVLIDDLMNRGKSFMRSIAVLESLGKQVVRVCAILRFRRIEYYDDFTRRGIEIRSLFTLDDFSARLEPSESERATMGSDLFSPLWKFESDNPNYFHVNPKSAPVIDERAVYFGSDRGAFWAIAQEDGRALWRFDVRFGDAGKRIFSSPAISAKRKLVYFGAYDGNVYALHAENGVLAWVFDEADWVGSSPALAEDIATVFIGLEFGLWNKRGGIAALHAATGRKRWEHRVESLVHSSPKYSRRFGAVVCGSNGGIVYCLDAKSGAVRWTHAAGGEVKGSFAFDEDKGLVLFGSFAHHITALDIHTGTPVFSVPTLHSVYSDPLVVAGTAFMGALDKRVYAVDLATGAVQWTFRTGGRVFSSPLMVRGTLYIGSNDGRLYAIDAKSGAEVGYAQLTERIVNRAAYNPSTQRFFVPTFANEIYCLARRH